jgi:hypothetical protein
MGRRDTLNAEKFQKIYINPPHSRRGTQFLGSIKYAKEEIVTFTVQKPDKLYPSQVNKANINGHKLY